ncbi:MAG: hypothetical protein FJX35_03135 [Alphaproteobacteria bacterium]|nr:hypothetical protein [Alphaproteobacteria bacterium]
MLPIARILVAATLLALQGCVVQQWTAADTQPIQAAKSRCAAAAREATPEPQCGPVGYTWVDGRPSFEFRTTRYSQCSNHQISAWTERWGEGYAQCLARASVSP